MEQSVNVSTETNVLSVKEWFITLLIAAIPIVGWIMLFVWGFGGGANPNKANWAKGALLLIFIVFVLYAFIALIFGGMLFMHSMD